MYIKKQIFNNIIFGDLYYDLMQEVGKPASITNSKMPEGAIDVKVRSAVVKKLDPTWYPDFCKEIESLCQEFNSKHIASTLKTRELEYLKYGLSDHFVRHQDAGSRDQRPRRFTSITMLSKTDDLVGGQLSVFDHDNVEHIIDLQVGETVLFYSTTWHQVTALTQGGREVLVAWVYDR
jgi:predicted 2-oxoglutarate/Fe(II)-dependent dioxygenase YbiX